MFEGILIKGYDYEILQDFSRILLSMASQNLHAQKMQLPQAGRENFDVGLEASGMGGGTAESSQNSKFKAQFLLFFKLTADGPWPLR